MEEKSIDLTCLGQLYRLNYVKTVSKAQYAISRLQEKDVTFGLDLETMALDAYKSDPTAPLDPLRSVPRLLQICDGKNVLVFDLLHLPLKLFTPFLETKKLLAHNAMFELQHCIHNFGCKQVNIGCTYLATKLLHHAYYVDDGAAKAGLEDVVQGIFKEKLFKDISHKFWGEPELNFEQIEYAAKDAIVVLRIADRLRSGLHKYGLEKVYALYKASQWPLAKMQLNGIKLDACKHRMLINVWKADAYKAKKELLKMTGLTELTSHTMASYLQNRLDPDILAIWPRTEKGKLSTDADAFSEFSWVDVVEPFARFQKATILSSTFGMKLQNKISPVSGRVHAQYKLCGTRTGRLSSSNPNLQNMPHDESFRSLFIPESGNVFVVADYGQIELRVAAELSRDTEMLTAYRNGIDLHSLTASRTSGVAIGKLTKDHRQRAKALNFGLLIGLGANGFKHYAKKQYEVNLTENAALDAVNAWHELYSGYSAWQKKQAEECKKELKVRTVSGKLRRLSEDNYYGASANTPVQGSASECILQALVTLGSTLNGHGKLVNTVHDEIAVECENRPDIIEHVKQEVIFAMEGAFVCLFPTGSTRNLVSIGSGANWAEAK